MFRSLYLKLVLIMALLMISIMAVVGTFLINSVEVYHLDEFTETMQAEFSGNARFAAQLYEAASAEDAPAQLSEVLEANSGNLGIDLYNRNFYILDADTGKYLAGSDEESGKTLEITPNIVTAMGGEVGYARAMTASYIDVAIPISGNENAESGYILYIRDIKQRQQELTTELFLIILQSLLFGLIIALLLSFLLSKTITTPIEGLIHRAGAMARGEFTGRIENASGDEIGVLTDTFNDMAEKLKKTLETVENERDKLNTLFLRMTDGVCAFDREGKLIHRNVAARKLIGIGDDPEIRYSSIFESVLPFTDALAIKPQEYFESNYDVNHLTLKVFIAPFGDNDREGGVMAVIHDVTEQTRLDRVRREFVANVSHELRTPLTNVRGYTETLMENEDIDRETQMNFLGVILKESDRMTRIVSDLLTLSRFDYGNIGLSIRRVQISKLIERVYEAMYLDAAKHKHNMTMEFKGWLPEILCDSDRIEQVLANVISNAIKYTPDGGDIEICAWQDDDYVVIAVRDTGVGIPEKDLERLFERFYRVDKARSRDAGGSGLGLSIAKEIVERHDGTIRIGSSYGHGTTVTVRLPIGGEGKS